VYSAPGLALGRYSLGVGDRFAHEAEAQLRAFTLAAGDRPITLQVETRVVLDDVRCRSLTLHRPARPGCPGQHERRSPQRAPLERAARSDRDR